MSILCTYDRCDKNLAGACDDELNGLMVIINGGYCGNRVSIEDDFYDVRSSTGVPIVYTEDDY